MSFNWSQYLDLARELTGKDTTPATEEAKLRSAISRSYYAAFIEARNFLRDRESLTIPRENSHQFVISQFKNSPDDESRRKLGERLQILRSHRRQADYEDTITGLIGKSEEALGLARRIILGISNL